MWWRHLKEYLVWRCPCRRLRTVSLTQTTWLSMGSRPPRTVCLIFPWYLMYMSPGIYVAGAEKRMTTCSRQPYSKCPPISWFDLVVAGPSFILRVNYLDLCKVYVTLYVNIIASVSLYEPPSFHIIVCTLPFLSGGIELCLCQIIPRRYGMGVSR